jgi:hypothetical protein
MQDGNSASTYPPMLRRMRTLLICSLITTTAMFFACATDPQTDPTETDDDTVDVETIAKRRPCNTNNDCGVGVCKTSTHECVDCISGSDCPQPYGSCTSTNNCTF